MNDDSTQPLSSVLAAEGLECLTANSVHRRRDPAAEWAKEGKPYSWRCSISIVGTANGLNVLRPIKVLPRNAPA